MSIAATASQNLFGAAMSAHQTVARNTPAVMAATKFSDFLREKQAVNQPVSPTVSPAPTPEQLAKSLFGSAHKGGIPLDKLAADARKDTAEFAGQLRQSLADADIDPNLPLELAMGAGGRIIVDGNHPKAAEISKLFEESPALAQAYRNVAGQNDKLAMQQTAGAYIKDWNATTSDGERQASWNRYSTLMDKLGSMFSGRMTFGPGTVVAESQQMLRRMNIA